MQSWGEVLIEWQGDTSGAWLAWMENDPDINTLEDSVRHLNLCLAEQQLSERKRGTLPRTYLQPHTRIAGAFERIERQESVLGREAEQGSQETILMHISPRMITLIAFLVFVAWMIWLTLTKRKL